MSISEAKSADYTFFSSRNECFEPDRPILTVFIDCYYRLDLTMLSVRSVLAQDYPNVELILIDNGSKPDVAEYIEKIYKSSTNTSLIKFPVNQFAWDDTEKSVAVCWNAALIHARGDYCSHLAYDDCISQNYAGRMVALFTGNPECITAAPMPVSIDEFGKVNPSSLRDMNTRKRYTNGLDLAIDLIEGRPKKLFASPGEILVIKREILLRYGGYDRIIDVSQTLKYAILGLSGFDPEASLYWRHHEGQLNKQAKNKGFIFYASFEKGWKDSGIMDIWKERYSIDMVAALMAFKKKSSRRTPRIVLAENVNKLNVLSSLLTLFNIFKECPSLLPGSFCTVVRVLTSLVYRKLNPR